MKSKLVLWGNDANDTKVLVALQLRPEDNKVDVWTFPVSMVTDEFSRTMLHEWRDGSDVDFPEGFTHLERDLAAADTLLPDDIKVDKLDLVQRAQTEWHFLVLSHKLNMLYQSELDAMRDRISKLESYDQGIWDELKTFWDKVREQVASRNLMREQADMLRNSINDLFTQLKNLRSLVDDEFRQSAAQNFEKYSAMLAEIETRIREQINTSDIFEELKKLQADFKGVSVSREMRYQVWDRIDGAFKAVKEKRFGSSYNSSFAGGTVGERISRRYEGLVSAIDKMQESIKRDREELEMQVKKIASNTVGQLEMQIIEAKMNMIKTRVSSKEEKLAEMNGTRSELDAQKNRPQRERAEAPAAPVAEVQEMAVKTPAPEAKAPEVKAPEAPEEVQEMAVKTPAPEVVEAVEAAPAPAAMQGSHPDDADAADLAF